MQLVALQINSQVSWTENQVQIANLLHRLPDERPCLVLLPENFACMGSTDDFRRVAENLGSGRIQRQLGEWAREFGIWLVAGSLPTLTPQMNRLHDTSLVYNPQGELVDFYHKLHLFDVELAEDKVWYRESDTFAAGTHTTVVPTPLGGVGLSICYDLRFPELYHLLRQRGADILLVPSAFTQSTGQVQWLPLLQARAIENQCYVVAANQCGLHSGNLETWGNSMIICPWGNVLALQGAQPGLISAKIDLQKHQHIRKTMPVIRHARFTPAWRE